MGGQVAPHIVRLKRIHELSDWRVVRFHLDIEVNVSRFFVSSGLGAELASLSTSIAGLRKRSLLKGSIAFTSAPMLTRKLILNYLCRHLTDLGKTLQASRSR